MRRRTFMVSGLAATVFARTSMAGLLDTWPVDMSRPATLFLLDPHVPQSHAVARAAVAAGATAFMLEPDVTGIWQHLDDAWRTSGGRSPYAVSGVTAGNVLFVIERLARDYGLHTIYRGLHTRGDDGRLDHQVHGAALTGSAVGDQLQPDWSVLGQSLVNSAFVARTAMSVVTTPTEPDPDAATFTSWLLAPLSGQAHGT